MKTTGWIPLDFRKLLKAPHTETVGDAEVNVFRSPSNLPLGVKGTFDEEDGYADFEFRYAFDEPGVVLEADGSQIEIGRNTAKILRVRVPIPPNTPITGETITKIIVPEVGRAIEEFARKPKKWLVRRDNMKMVQEAILSKGDLFVRQIGAPAAAH